MTGRDIQLPLDLRHRAAMGRDDFLVSPSNSEAVAWIDRWPDWPGPALVLVGPPGSGKTHLGRVWQKQAEAVAHDFENPVSPSGELNCFFVDGICADYDEDLFHLFNSVSESKGHLLISAEIPPVRWENRLADLKSRLAAAPNITIQMPDETLIAAVMLKMFSDQQMDVSTDVLSYLLNRMERSFEAARTLVDALNSASLAQRRGITVPLAREVLTKLAG
ncbi:MAG: DNA replication protein [Rhodospirillaceae bacterium]|nr:DNA replication protein [Rhodospirillaceae bacterium]|tara:strand:+ start:4165 stop:4824 length:660 start_codon:yes stop_codon:yes gene_type:complete